jgi:hypothetical protein
MPSFSRWMDPIPERRFVPWPVIAAVIVIALVVFILVSRFAFVLLAALLSLVVAATFVERRRLEHMFRGRAGEGLCTFVRDDSVRDADPWVLRAVFEGFQEYLAPQNASFALRGSDGLLDTLRVDDMDLVLDLIPEMARRCRRSLPLHDDPSWAQLRTVSDLVAFLDMQQCLSDHPASAF